MISNVEVSEHVHGYLWIQFVGLGRVAVEKFVVGYYVFQAGAADQSQFMLGLLAS